MLVTKAWLKSKEYLALLDNLVFYKVFSHIFPVLIYFICSAGSLLIGSVVRSSVQFSYITFYLAGE